MSRSVLEIPQRAQPDFGSATLRHVSSEGCQIRIADARPKVGQRLRLRLESMGQITGTVRWSVGDRAGFEFDEPISLRRIATLEKLPTETVVVRVYPA